MLTFLAGMLATLVLQAGGVALLVRALRRQFDGLRLL
jgi:hypothetical protein